MPDQEIINIVRRETWLLEIYKALNNNPKTQSLTTELSKTIRSIYRYIEPSHFDGKLLVFVLIDDQHFLNISDATLIFDKNILMNMTTQTLILGSTKDSALMMWENIDTTDIYQHRNAIFYEYENGKECFYANNKKISIQNHFNSLSIFCNYYSKLNNELERYRLEKILHSSCEIFKDSWKDSNRIFLINGPENNMQISLKEFLSSSIRGVEVNREFNLGASKPVDLRVYWKEANRSAIIEVKWLGKSKNIEGRITQNFSNSRAVEGIDQIKEYMDLNEQDTPTCITKGYLVVIDARRRATNKNTININSNKGLYYQDKDLTFPETKEFYKSIVNIEKPIRIFAKPICI